MFDSSPGGNANFERAPFKLALEMVDVMGGSVVAEPFCRFAELCVRCYLVSRFVGYYCLEKKILFRLAYTFELCTACLNTKIMHLIQCIQIFILQYLLSFFLFFYNST